MQAKKDLASRIVADFHSAHDAAKAAEDWAKQFQRSEEPEEIEEVRVRYQDVRSDDKDAGIGGDLLVVRLDRLLVLCGMAESMSDAARKLKAGSVRLLNLGSGKEFTQRFLEIPVIQGAPIRLVVRVGKKIKAVVVEL